MKFDLGGLANQSTQKFAIELVVDEDENKMTIQKFEERLKELDQKFSIVLHPVNPELAGVYYDRNIENKSGFVVTVPAGEIREEFEAGYADSTGHPHNYASRVIAICNEHLRRMKEDPEYAESFTAPIDFTSAQIAPK